MSQIVNTLLDSGAHINELGGTFGAALNAAADASNEKVVQLLINRGADVNEYGHRGTPLLSATQRQCTRIARLLVDSGAIDLQTEKGNALEAASSIMGRARKEMIELLQRASATNTQEKSKAMQAGQGSEEVVLVESNDLYVPLIGAEGASEADKLQRTTIQNKEVLERADRAA